MALTRTQIVKHLEPGLNAIFGQAYKGYENEHEVLFDKESSSRAFEEEVLFPGFAGAFVKPEGSAVAYAETGEGYTARHVMDTIALAFALTEEAMEDNLYDSMSKRLSKALARAMAHTKQVKAAAVYNNGFSSIYPGGDGKELFATNHPLQDGGTGRNELSTAADLSETSLETALIDIAGITDDKSIPIALQARSLHIPRQLLFVAERIMRSPYRPATADNDVNAIYNTGMLPGGYHVNHRFTDTDAWFIRTDCPDGMKHFERVGISTKMEGDFESGNMRYKARERYSFGWSDWRAAFGSAGN